MTLRSILTSAAAGFFPVSAGPPPSVTDEVAVWWADDLGYSNTDPIDTWTDRVGGLDLTASTTHRPTMVTSGINGKASVAFDASSEQMLNSAAGSSPTSSEDGSIIAVILPNNTAANKGIVSITSVPYDLFFLLNENEYPEITLNSATTDYLRNTTAAVSAISPTILEFTSNGSITSGYINNSSIALSAYSSDDTNDGAWTADADYNSSNTIFVIGGAVWDDPPTFYSSEFDGQIAFIGVYDTPVAGVERTALYDWLADYYGITI